MGVRCFAAVSLEDLEFLRKHNYGAARPAAREEEKAPDPDPPEMIRLIHPDLMPIELVEEAYELTNGATDPDVIEWRGKACLTIRLARGNGPEHPHLVIA